MRRRNQKKNLSPVGFEPATFRSGVERWEELVSVIMKFKFSMRLRELTATVAPQAHLTIEESNN
jgi:hypothetical protein